MDKNISWIKITTKYIMITMDYLLQFLFGGTLMTLVYYFSKKNTLFCALIPTLPIFFLTGLFYIYKFKGNCNNYIIHSIVYILCYLTFLLLLYGIFHNNNQLLLYTIMALVIYGFLLFYISRTFKMKS